MVGKWGKHEEKMMDTYGKMMGKWWKHEEPWNRTRIIHKHEATWKSGIRTFKIIRTSGSSSRGICNKSVLSRTCPAQHQTVVVTWCTMSHHRSPSQGSPWCCERQCCTCPAVLWLATELVDAEFDEAFDFQSFWRTTQYTIMWGAWTILAWFRFWIRRVSLGDGDVFCSCSVKFHIFLPCTNRY